MARKTAHDHSEWPAGPETALRTCHSLPGEVARPLAIPMHSPLLTVRERVLFAIGGRLSIKRWLFATARVSCMLLAWLVELLH